MELDFEIDKITESIESAETGESFETRVVPVSAADLKEVAKINGWRFDWRLELSQPERQVYKLITEKEPNIIQGLISLEKEVGFMKMPLIESAPFNVGKTKRYKGVCGNMVAYGCKLSFEMGFCGYLSFISKTDLIGHYVKTLGAVHLGGQRMAMFEDNARLLVNNYFPKERKI
jgi:hypothetical protein